jgi:hypothetical protein
MNIFEFIAILALTFGLVWGVYGAADGGLWAALRGGLVGAGKGFLGYAAFMLSIMAALALGLRYRPMFPRCKRGKCKDEHFTYLYLDTEPPEPDKALEQKHQTKLVRCRCGDLYLRDARARKFYEVREDRALVPFMRYSFCGRWRPDQDAPMNPTV